MIDLARLREHPQETIALLKKKEPRFDAQQLYDLDKETRVLKQEVEALRQTKNELGKAGRGGQISSELREQSLEVGKSLKIKETELEQIEARFKQLYLACPNIPFADLPEGNKEANKVVKTVGAKPNFDFKPKNHVELGTALGWLDFEAAARIAGNNFALYKGQAVDLLYALTSLMLKINRSYGFEPVLPPVLVNAKSLEVSGNFPKFKEEVYSIVDEDLYLAPTSEVCLANMYRNYIFDDLDLPKRMTSWTSCFRREAGGYGAHERGLIRIHQFEKVELYSLCQPDRSEQELDLMLVCAQDLLLKLGLHYRVSLLAAQDCSFQSAKTYDIEVWLPGQGQYYEVSSASNCTDFQARRGLMRYKPLPEDKPELVHTLNASSLALPRLMVAIMETFQQADGSIEIPYILKKEMSVE